MSVLCEACRVNEGTHHVSVWVDVFSVKSEKRKGAQFWLCPDCVRIIQKLFTRDGSEKGRVARALTTVQERAIPAPGWPVRQDQPGGQEEA